MKTHAEVAHFRGGRVRHADEFQTLLVCAERAGRTVNFSGRCVFVCARTSMQRDGIWREKLNQTRRRHTLCNTSRTLSLPRRASLFRASERERPKRDAEPEERRKRAKGKEIK